MPSSFASLPIYIQADTDELHRLNLGLLVLGYGGISVDSPQDAYIIVITDRNTRLGKDLIATYSVGPDDTIAVAVVDQKWIHACVSERRPVGESVGGIPCGGYYIRPDICADRESMLNEDDTFTAGDQLDSPETFNDINISATSSGVTDDFTCQLKTAALPNTDDALRSALDPDWEHPTVKAIMTELGSEVHKKRNKGLTYTKQEVAAFVCYLARNPLARPPDQSVTSQELLRPWWESTNKIHSLVGWVLFYSRNRAKLEKAAKNLAEEWNISSASSISPITPAAAREQPVIPTEQRVVECSDPGGENEEFSDEDAASVFSSSSRSSSLSSLSASLDIQNSGNPKAPECALELVTLVSRELSKAGDGKLRYCITGEPYSQKEAEATIHFLARNPIIYEINDKRKRSGKSALWKTFTEKLHRTLTDIPKRSWQSRSQFFRTHQPRMQQAADALRRELRDSAIAGTTLTGSQDPCASASSVAPDDDIDGDLIECEDDHVDPVPSDDESMDEALEQESRPNASPTGRFFTPMHSEAPHALVEAVAENLSDRINTRNPWSQDEIRAIIYFMAANPHVYKSNYRENRRKGITREGAWKQFTQDIDDHIIFGWNGASLPSRTCKARQDFHKMNQQMLDMAADALLESQQTNECATTFVPGTQDRQNSPVPPTEQQTAMDVDYKHQRSQSITNHSNETETVAEALRSPSATLPSQCDLPASPIRPKVGFTALANSRRSSYSTGVSSLDITPSIGPSSPLIARSYTPPPLKLEAIETVMELSPPPLGIESSFTTTVQLASPPSIQHRMPSLHAVRDELPSSILYRTFPTWVDQPSPSPGAFLLRPVRTSPDASSSSSATSRSSSPEVGTEQPPLENTLQLHSSASDAHGPPRKRSADENAEGGWDTNNYRNKTAHPVSIPSSLLTSSPSAWDYGSSHDQKRIRLDLYQDGRTSADSRSEYKDQTLCRGWESIGGVSAVGLF
ncbi:hypothetical protein FRB94_006064 [Tulasnella sp. JGI-2019a]|nr:hypothetical protein FRB94_006064 [Tulasnella sp. JGI-2019a]